VGKKEGFVEGYREGVIEGASVGNTDGIVEGFDDGEDDGLKLMLGASDARRLGAALLEGAMVGPTPSFVVLCLADCLFWLRTTRTTTIVAIVAITVIARARTVHFS
jgi:hypothetical protein